MEKNNFYILLVDDDNLNQRMMGLLLSDAGYIFDIASNGVEAVEAVQSQNYDLVLMDLQMPVLDGYEATRRIRSWEAGNGHVPVIALTAMLFDEDDVQLCLDAGIDECIIKPFNTTQLFQTIDSHIRKSIQSTEIQNTQEDKNENEHLLLDVQAALPRFGNEIRIYQEFLNEFLQSLQDQMKQFRFMLISGDLLSISRAAHNLKGVSASMGAMQLSVVVSKLNQQSHDGEANLIEASLDECDKIVSDLQENAMKILSSNGYNISVIK